MMQWKLLERARKAFEDHELTIVEPWRSETKRGEYIWRNPKGGMYMAHIIFRPGAIIIYGDVQPNLIFIQYDLDLPWLRGAIDSPDYLFEKAPVQKVYDAERTKEFAWEMLAEWREERVNERRELVGNDAEKHAYIYGLFTGADWDEPEAAVDVLGELTSDPHECLSCSYEAVGLDYVLAALQTFIEALGKKLAEKAQEPQYVQLLNPRTNRYVKIDRVYGGIVGHKDTEGPYEDIPIYERRS